MVRGNTGFGGLDVRGREVLNICKGSGAGGGSWIRFTVVTTSRDPPAEYRGYVALIFMEFQTSYFFLIPPSAKISIQSWSD